AASDICDTGIALRTPNRTTDWHAECTGFWEEGSGVSQAKERYDGRAIGQRRVVDEDRAVDSQASLSHAERGTAPGGRPSRAGGHSVRAQNGDPLGRPAAAVRLLRHDLLAAAAGLAGGRR